ncbi:hypothetical protein Mpsy_0898 [Methanolobus psychrophilus R15]|nr:hypothetical protein Mpsy_0898 [Methanolobus psychrophilus R15]
MKHLAWLTKAGLFSLSFASPGRSQDGSFFIYLLFPVIIEQVGTHS